jgi:hypothetical protein
MCQWLKPLDWGQQTWHLAGAVGADFPNDQMEYHARTRLDHGSGRLATLAVGGWLAEIQASGRWVPGLQAE